MLSFCASNANEGSILIVFEFMDLEDELSGEDAGAGPFGRNEASPSGAAIPCFASVKLSGAEGQK